MTQPSETFTPVLQFDSQCFSDSRGTFLKVFDAASSEIREFRPQQINYVQTPQKNTLRGLHYQLDEYAESKIFRVIKGTIQLAWVDLRAVVSEISAHCGSVVLNKPTSAILVPRGFATGYLTLEPDTEVLYLSDNIYVPEYERGLRWDDPTLHLHWIHRAPAVSEKDSAWPFLSSSC